MISVIIRTKNEERWIVPCLKRVLKQDVDDEIEIILVDNKSTDKTVVKARNVCPDLKLVISDDFRPGLALNDGIRASRGDYIVCLSAHCLPVNSSWLKTLKSNLKNESIGGVYGRQVPLKYSDPIDKRDLLIIFGLDRRIQIKDGFFHNANSMIPRDLWERFPFDEEVSNIEDRLWGKKVIKAGYKIVYEPNAPVYHHHGIHQNLNRERCINVVRILEEVQDTPKEGIAPPLHPGDLTIVAMIPVRPGIKGIVDWNRQLLQYTVDDALSCKYVDKVVILTDSEDVRQVAENWGVSVPFIRPKELSLPKVRLNKVLQFSLQKLESQGYYPDLVVTLEILYPFRPVGLLDNLIEHLLDEGLDTVIAGFPEYRPCWSKNRGDELVRMDNFEVHMMLRDPLQIGSPGTGCVTYPEIIRQGKRFGERVGVFEMENPICTLGIRDPKYLELFHKIKLLYSEFKH